jgi:hypothetical protein
MSLKSLAAGVVAAAVTFTGLASHAHEPRPDQLVDALNAVFGKHAGERAAHAKGICLSGSFSPAASAASLSKAPQFAKEVPITARFSLGGDPNAKDNEQANVRGFAIRFDNCNGANSDLVMISAPVFFAQTPAPLPRAAANPRLGGQGQAQGLLRGSSRIDAAERLAHVPPGPGELCRGELLGRARLHLHQRRRQNAADQI